MIGTGSAPTQCAAVGAAAPCQVLRPDVIVLRPDVIVTVPGIVVIAPATVALPHALVMTDQEEATGTPGIPSPQLRLEEGAIQTVCLLVRLFGARRARTGGV